MEAEIFTSVPLVFQAEGSHLERPQQSSEQRVAVAVCGDHDQPLCRRVVLKGFCLPTFWKKPDVLHDFLHEIVVVNA